MTFARLPLALVVSALTLAGCGQKSPSSEEAPVADAPAQDTAPPPAPAQQNSNPVTAALSVEDIERWQRGVQAEAAAVQEASARLDEAKNNDEKLDAITAATELKTLEKGAAAAGLSTDRYRFVRNTFSNAVSQLTPLEQEMDVSAMPKEMLEQMRQAREASVAQLAGTIPADVIEALRPKASELRKQDVTLAGERVKIATRAR